MNLSLFCSTKTACRVIRFNPTATASRNVTDCLQRKRDDDQIGKNVTKPDYSRADQHLFKPKKSSAVVGDSKKSVNETVPANDGGLKKVSSTSKYKTKQKATIVKGKPNSAAMKARKTERKDADQPEGDETHASSAKKFKKDIIPPKKKAASKPPGKPKITKTKTKESDKKSKADIENKRPSAKALKASASASKIDMYAGLSSAARHKLALEEAARQNGNVQVDLPNVEIRGNKPVRKGYEGGRIPVTSDRRQKVHMPSQFQQFSAGKEGEKSKWNVDPKSKEKKKQDAVTKNKEKNQKKKKVGEKHLVDDDKIRKKVSPAATKKEGKTKKDKQALQDDQAKADKKDVEEVKTDKKEAEEAKTGEKKDDEAKTDVKEADEAKTGKKKDDEAKTDETKANEAETDKKEADEAKTDEKEADEAKTDEADEAKTDKDEADEAKTDKNEAHEAKTDKNEADEAKTDKNEADEAKTDEKEADEAKTDKKVADEAKVDENEADEAKSDKKEADEAKTDENEADEAKADKKEADEAKTDEKESDEAKTDEKKADEAKPDKEEADEAKTDEKEAEEAKKDNGKKKQHNKNKPQKRKVDVASEKALEPMTGDLAVAAGAQAKKPKQKKKDPKMRPRSGGVAQSGAKHISKYTNDDVAKSEVGVDNVSAARHKLSLEEAARQIGNVLFDLPNVEVTGNKPVMQGYDGGPIPLSSDGGRKRVKRPSAGKGEKCKWNVDPKSKEKKKKGAVTKKKDKNQKKKDKKPLQADKKKPAKGKPDKKKPKKGKPGKKKPKEGKPDKNEDEDETYSIELEDGNDYEDENYQEGFSDGYNDNAEVNDCDDYDNDDGGSDDKITYAD